jgi:hypothetical protein
MTISRLGRLGHVSWLPRGKSPRLSVSLCKETETRDGDETTWSTLKVQSKRPIVFVGGFSNGAYDREAAVEAGG